MTKLELLVFLAVVLLAGGAAAIARSRARAPRGSSAGRARAALLPSDLERGWTAEIEWRLGESDSRFWVMASADDDSRRAPVAQSAALEWPPSGPAAVKALSGATRALEEALLSAGWAPLPAGDAWYAKRFRWEPDPAAARPATAQPADGPTEAARENGAPGHQAGTARPVAAEQEEARPAAASPSADTGPAREHSGEFERDPQAWTAETRD